MRDSLHVRLYADSLGLPRKNYVSSDQRYINLLCDWLSEKFSKKIRLVDNSKSNSLIHSLYHQFLEDETYFEPADILIIHEGVCDCAPRPIPQKIRKLISKFPSFIRKRIVMFIHNNRSFLQQNGMRFHLTNEKNYENIYSLWLEKLSKTKTIVFLFEIAPTNDSIEMQSPGFRESIKKYNLLLENAVKKINGSNIHLIKINSLICKQSNINNYIIEEDGHHITSKAHTLYFNSIKEVLDLEEAI